MDSPAPSSWLRFGTETTTYALPGGASPTVRVGDDVQRGDILAHVATAPHMIALAEELHLSGDACRCAIASLEGASVAANAPIHDHRSGLRVRTVRAPHAGVIDGMPKYNAIIVRPEETHDALRAVHPGLVTSVESEAIIVASHVVRCAFAFAVGHPAASIFRAMPDDLPPQSPRVSPDGLEGRPGIRALAHIETVADLTSMQRRGANALIVGTISDMVAWELLTRDSPSAGRENPSIIVLFGTGTLALGAAAIGQLRPFDGAAIRTDRRAREIILLPADASNGATDDQQSAGAIYVDPARWNTPCIVESAPHLALLDSGARPAVIRTSANGHGEEQTPLDAIASRPES